ncbi:MAG: hypothetical protein IJQ73_07175 [Kiritimatiellae bacterium]|nr:hypothetical protein [Kiritimatiellia bacterium]
MSEEDKKPAEDIEPKAEEKKDAEGQDYCGWQTNLSCGSNISHNGYIRPGRCGGTSSTACGSRLISTL